MHSQSGQPHCTAGIAMITPAAPIIEPIERSNSPPIISIEAATAMMPSWAETSRKLMMPGAENRPLPPATTPKKMKTRMVPATAPSSGRAISLRISGVSATRSSTVRSWSLPRHASPGLRAIGGRPRRGPRVVAAS